MVVNVLKRPALKPLGASSVTLMEFCRRVRGKELIGSQVIHSLKSSWMNCSLSGCRIDIMSSMRPMPKWQFCRMTQLPLAKASYKAARATFSYPSPMDTFMVTFFFFLASSSMV